MHLEDPPPSLEDVLANSELLVACYYIIESAVSYMASDRLAQLDQRQRDQVSDPEKNISRVTKFEMFFADNISTKWRWLKFFINMVKDLVIS